MSRPTPIPTGIRPINWSTLPLEHMLHVDMIHYSDPPTLLRNVIPNVDEVVRLLERNAPYTPLGGWFRGGLDEDDEATNAMWFQNDWVHADLAVEGSDLFFWHEGVIEASKKFYDAEVIVPQSIYVNLMAAIDRAGPAHTDNPRFQGRDRSNSPMWLLRSMLWSGLFDRWSIVQSTSIWWMNDLDEGGAIYYWPDGPNKPRHEHHGDMANTSLIGDNHGMFHQVGPVGPYDNGTLLVTSRAELAPATDGSADWVVTDRGEERFRAPLSKYRVSVLWKADVYKNEEERKRQMADTLSLEDVARIFDEDLADKGRDLRFEIDRIDDVSFQEEIKAVYPEARPIGAAPSIYGDAY